MIDTSGTKEGERVQTWGTVEAAPKPVNRGKSSPLQFFLDVPLPEKARVRDGKYTQPIKPNSKSREENLPKATDYTQCCISIPGQWIYKMAEKPHIHATTWQPL